ncbi:MAG: hypothetical protein Q9217_000566 [Psora testacea]
MVFPATATTGPYEVQNPPSGYPALEIRDRVVITASTFSTLASPSTGAPSPTTTTTMIYPSFPGLTLTVATTTWIRAVLATPVSFPANCPVGLAKSTLVAGATFNPHGPPITNTTNAQYTLPLAVKASVSTLISYIQSKRSSDLAPDGRSWNNSSNQTSARKPGVERAAPGAGTASSFTYQAPTSVPNQGPPSTGAQVTVSKSTGRPAVPDQISPGSQDNAKALPLTWLKQPNGRSTGSGGSVQATSSSNVSDAASTALVSSLASSHPVNAPIGLMSGVTSSIAGGSISQAGNPGQLRFSFSSNGLAVTPEISNPSAARPSTSISQAFNSQSLQLGAVVITSIVTASEPVRRVYPVIETFVPTTYSALTTLSSTTTTSSVVTRGSSNITTIPVTIYPGGVAWGIPSVDAGNPILLPPATAPQLNSPSQSGSQSALAGTSSSTSKNSLGSLTTITDLPSQATGSSKPFIAIPLSITKAPPSQATDLSKPFIAIPLPITKAPPSSEQAALTVFSGTTTPTASEISTGVSSDGHTDASGVPFPIPVFWGRSDFCSLFCPSRGDCALCGYSINLEPGIYRFGSITWPPGWKAPPLDITIKKDGTPEYDEEQLSSDSRNSQSQTSEPSTSSTSYTSASLTSSSPSSSTFGGALCDVSCSACVAGLSPPSSPQAKRRSGTMSALQKRIMERPSDDPYRGDIDEFIAGLYHSPHRRIVRASWDLEHPSSASYYDLLNVPFNLAVANLYGCTSLVLTSTKGIWMSHFWEQPSFFDKVLGEPNPEKFQKHVIDILGPGDNTGNFPGISQYIGPGKPFGPDTRTEASIVTPQDRVDPIPGETLYPDMIDKLDKEVRRLFEVNDGLLNGDPKIVDYYPVYVAPPESEWIANGKVIFQYHPQGLQCGDGYNAVGRLWVEEEQEPARDYAWEPWPQQRPNNQRRGLRAAGGDDGGVQYHKRAEPGSAPSGTCFMSKASTTPGALFATVATGTKSSNSAPSTFTPASSTTDGISSAKAATGSKRSNSTSSTFTSAASTTDDAPSGTPAAGSKSSNTAPSTLITSIKFTESQTSNGVTGTGTVTASPKASLRLQ